MRPVTRWFGRAAALCGAFGAAAALPDAARADELVPALTLQTGAAFTRSPGNDQNGFFIAATPQLGYYFGSDRTQVGIAGSVTASLDTALPNGIASTLSLTIAHDIAPTTRLLLGASVLQSSVGNYLLVKRTADTQVSGLSTLNSQLGTLTLTEGLRHEISENVTLSQSVSGTYVRSLDLDVRLDNYILGAVIGAERSWTFDALGAELNVEYARSIVPPLVRSRAIVLSLGPTWDHDFSRSWTSSVGIAAAVAFSPDEGTKTQVAPMGRASFLYYTDGGSGASLAYAGGFEPNLFLGTILRAHQVTLRAYTPISDVHRVLLSVSGGFLRATTLDLREGANGNEFDAVLHDAEISWGLADFLNLSLRYQFVGQTAGSGLGATPPLVRHAAILGLDIFGGGRPTKPRVQTRFPQRVDGGDAPPIDKPLPASPNRR